MKLQDLMEGKTKYKVDNWVQHLGIPKEIIELYGLTGENQHYGKPEAAMLKAQSVIGSGDL